MNAWWTYLERPTMDASNGFDTDWATCALGRAALEGGAALRFSHPAGVLRGEMSALVAELRELGGRVVFERVQAVSCSNAGVVLVWPDALVSVWNQRGDDWVAMPISCANERLMARLVEVAARRLMPRSESG